MCLIAFAIGASERWPLVIAANRDEFLNRPTLPMARWQTDTGQEVISGRDLRAGGTWLGVNPAGRVAMLTNVREPQQQAGERSRGELPMRWLEGRMDAAEFMAQTDTRAYGAFNLVIGDAGSSSWHWLSNQSGHAWQVRPLDPGIYGLSNGSLDTPWPKTLQLKQALRDALAAPDLENLRTSLWIALGNRQRADDELLPRTGVPLALERALSSVFVDFPEHGYGTRSSTVLVMTPERNKAGIPAHEVWIHEQTHRRFGEEGGSHAQDSPLTTSVEASLRLRWQRPH
jgi:uncharacterized protein with NRDE domain